MIKIRRATVSDIETIHDLIQYYSEQKILLPRTMESLYQNLQSIFVAEYDGRVVGSASLAILDKELAEIRSLVVDASMEKKGIGKLLVEKVIQETERLGIDKLISLTYQVEFFRKCGFEVTVKDTMPQKVWKDCINCPKMPSCDEIAMVYYTKGA
jgi:amino-acid N-acetyltransferase